ncbi:MAG: hypothetical protein AABZ60_18610 [Planctomycetota bacterium]
MKILFLLILVTFIFGCSITPESIRRHPAVGEISTVGMGDSIYTYEKQGKVFNDYMNGINTQQTPSWRYELLYSGLSKEILKITYREFANDLARASFFQEASYDYNKNGPTMVSFKGAKVEVLSADNNGIKYKVLSGFTDEEQAQAQPQ